MTILESIDTVIYQPEDAINPYIIYDSIANSITIQYGIEEIIYDILDTNTLLNTTTYELKMRLDYEVDRQINPITVRRDELHSDLSVWYYIDDVYSALFTTEPEKYRRIQE